MEKWIELLENNNFIGVKKYLNDGADVNEESDSGESVLACAIKYRCDNDLLMLLIEAGADIYDFDEEGVSIFDVSVAKNNIDMINYIIVKGYDVNTTKRKSGFTPLMSASSYGLTEVAKILLANGANINMEDKQGFKAVDFAKKMNKKNILELLDIDETQR